VADAECIGLNRRGGNIATYFGREGSNMSLKGRYSIWDRTSRLRAATAEDQ
jgi:hypothetical protein